MSPLAGGLRVAALLYGAALDLRALAYDRGWAPVHHLPAAVASVGNVAVGGTGKTPAVLYLARLLVQAGRRPAILSRGYRGSHARGAGRRGEPLVVGDGRGAPLAPPEVAGDEPVLLARRAGVPVVVCPDRVAGGRLAVDRFGADTLVLDDGFQHRRLARDLDVVLVDARRGFGDGRLLPAGRLRERPEALARAHVVLLTKGGKSASTDALSAAIRELAPRAAVFGARYRPVALAPLAAAGGFGEASVGGFGEASVGGFGTAGVGPLDAAGPDGARGAAAVPIDPGARPLAGRRVLAVSGLADPASFHDLLAELGARDVTPLPFPDHHRYEPGDHARIAAAAARADCLVTTEKDAVKLDPARLGPGPALVLEIALEPDDAAAFAAACLARLVGRL